MFVQQDVVLAALKSDDYVEHPPLDKVRECSTGPDQAADFFLQILHLPPTKRISIEAQQHPYVSEILKEMEAYCEKLNEQRSIEQ